MAASIFPADAVMDNDGYWYKLDRDGTKVYLCVVCRQAGADYVHRTEVGGPRDPRLCYCAGHKTLEMSHMYKAPLPSRKRRRHHKPSAYGALRRPRNAIVFPPEARVVARDGRRFVRTYRARPSPSTAAAQPHSKDDEEDSDAAPPPDPCVRLRHACECCWRRATYISGDSGSYTCAIHRMDGAKPLVRPCAVVGCSRPGVQVIELPKEAGEKLPIHRLCALHTSMPMKDLDIEVRKRQERRAIRLAPPPTSETASDDRPRGAV